MLGAKKPLSSLSNIESAELVRRRLMPRCWRNSKTRGRSASCILVGSVRRHMFAFACRNVEEYTHFSIHFWKLTVLIVLALTVLSLATKLKQYDDWLRIPLRANIISEKKVETNYNWIQGCINNTYGNWKWTFFFRYDQLRRQCNRDAPIRWCHWISDKLYVCLIWANLRPWI